MKLYNTLSKRLESIDPQKPPVVTVYTCGPTVYDFPHIGNWFTFLRYDLLIRTLQLSGFKPEWVMNITDVGHLVSDADEGEDKLEKGARREGKTAWDVAAYYTDYFVDGLKRLNFLLPNYLPKATEHIQEQIDLVTRLEEKGYTYIISDGVYFDTSKFPTYANFARLDLDEQQAGARVEYDPEKRNPSDFALWKLSPKDHQRDMEWASPWGRGFPGWHIECSAMSMKYLGETLDIHSGGIDHIPVHHTNEIAQSEAATGKPFANIWMHTNHISVEGEKISKSLCNSITLEDIEARGIDLTAFRLHVYESHYRSQSKFSWQSLQAAQNRLQGLRAFADLQFNLAPEEASPLASDQFALDEVIEYLQNDLNTPNALAVLQVRTDVLYGLASQRGGLPRANQRDFVEMLHHIDDMFGFTLAGRRDINQAEKDLIAARDAARQAKDWSTSDALRQQLEGLGIGLRDTDHGAIWFRLKD